MTVSDPCSRRRRSCRSSCWWPCRTAAAPTMIRPAFAPVPTAMEAVSPAALMLTVAVPAANPQLTAPSAGAGAATTATTIASNAIARQDRVVGDARARAAWKGSCTERCRPDADSKTTFHAGARSPVAGAERAATGRMCRSGADAESRPALLLVARRGSPDCAARGASSCVQAVVLASVCNAAVTARRGGVPSWAPAARREQSRADSSGGVIALRRERE